MSRRKLEVGLPLQYETRFAADGIRRAILGCCDNSVPGARESSPALRARRDVHSWLGRLAAAEAMAGHLVTRIEERVDGKPKLVACTQLHRSRPQRQALIRLGQP